MSGFYLIFLIDLKTIFNINPLQGIYKIIIYSSTKMNALRAIQVYKSTWCNLHS